MIESLEERLNGRYTKKTVKHPETGAVIIGLNELIIEDKARVLVRALNWVFAEYAPADGCGRPVFAVKDVTGVQT